MMQSLLSIRLVLFLTPLLIAGGCTIPGPCPETHNTDATPIAFDKVYVDAADPFLLGSLSARTLSIARCEYDAPVPMLIFAPENPGAYPVIVFQHGFMARNQAYSDILIRAATHGFIVVAPQMYEPGLAALFGSPTAAEETDLAMDLLGWLPAGLPAALSYTPALDRLGLAGHSRGGKVIWQILTAAPSRVRAAAGIEPVDGTGGPLGNQQRVVQGTFPFSLPALIIGTGLGGSCAPAGDNHEQFYAASRSPAWHIVVPNQGHGDMLDEDTAVAAAKFCAGGDNREGMRILTAGLMVAFFRASLQGDESAYAYLSNAAVGPIPFNVVSK